MGIDHAGYIDSSLGKTVRFGDKERIEIVWTWMNSVFKWIDIGPLFTIITSLLTLVPIFRLISKESENKGLSLLLFLLIPYGYCFFLTGIRQSLAAAIVVWAFYYLTQKRYILTAILSIIACGIHASAILVFPFFAVCFINIKKYILIILLIASALVGFLNRYSFFDFLGDITQYVEILSMYEGYASYHEDDELNLFGLISVIVPSTVFGIVSVMYNNKDELYNKLYCCGVIGTNVFASVPMIGRYFMYFTILQIILVPDSYRRSPLLIRMGLLLTLVYMVLYFYIFIPEATETLDYKFFFS